MADTDILQVIAEARIDARSLSEFVFKPADFMVTRRLAPTIHTLDYYLAKFDESARSANAVIANANRKILEADDIVADAYSGAEQRFFDTANNNLDSKIDVYLSAQDIGKSVFDTPQAGIDAGVTSGGYYSVRSADNNAYLEEYKNNNGTPEPTGKKYPSSAFVEAKACYTVSELMQIATARNVGTIFNAFGFYEKGDCKPSAFTLSTVTGNEDFTDIGNGYLIGKDASVKVDDTKKLVISKFADELELSQLGGVKTNVSKTIKNDAIATIILANFKVLIIDGFYTLQGSIWHGSNNVIKGIGRKVSGIRQGDNINKYTIQSINSDIKNAVQVNDYLELSDFEIDGNRAKNLVRDYGDDIDKTYWGFGVALFNIRHLVIRSMHVRHTNAWGISYHVCDIVTAEDITFDQVEGTPNNTDGITGSAKRVSYKKLKGYTADDLCAVGTGRSTLAGYDTGITARQNIEYIYIDDIEGVNKNGFYTHVGIGIYSDDIGEIDNISISNVRGHFRHVATRIANFWKEDKNLKVSSVKISNLGRIMLKNKALPYVQLLDLDCESAKIDGMHYIKTASDPLEQTHIINVSRSNIKVLDISNIIGIQDSNLSRLFLMNADGASIKALSVSNLNVELKTSEGVSPSFTDIGSGSFFLYPNISDVSNNGLETINIENCKVIGFNPLTYWQSIMYPTRFGTRVSIDYMNTDGLFEHIFSDKEVFPFDVNYDNRIAVRDSAINIRAKVDITDKTSLSTGNFLLFNAKHNLLALPKTDESQALIPKVSSDGVSLVGYLMETGFRVISSSVTGYPTGAEIDMPASSGRTVYINITQRMSE